jgi:hypothetical protein
MPTQSEEIKQVIQHRYDAPCRGDTDAHAKSLVGQDGKLEPDKFLQW